MKQIKKLKRFEKIEDELKLNYEFKKIIHLPQIIRNLSIKKER